MIADTPGIVVMVRHDFHHPLQCNSPVMLPDELFQAWFADITAGSAHEDQFTFFKPLGEVVIGMG